MPIDHPRSTCRPRVFLADKIALIINSGLGVCIILFIGFPKRIAAPDSQCREPKQKPIPDAQPRRAQLWLHHARDSGSIRQGTDS